MVAGTASRAQVRSRVAPSSCSFIDKVTRKEVQTRLPKVATTLSTPKFAPTPHCTRNEHGRPEKKSKRRAQNPKQALTSTTTRCDHDRHPTVRTGASTCQRSRHKCGRRHQVAKDSLSNQSSTVQHAQPSNPQSHYRYSHHQHISHRPSKPKRSRKTHLQ